MIGVIPCCGESARLYPYFDKPKHLLCYAGQVIIERLQTQLLAACDEVYVIVNDSVSKNFKLYGDVISLGSKKTYTKEDTIRASGIYGDLIIADNDIYLHRNIIPLLQDGQYTCFQHRGRAWHGNIGGMRFSGIYRNQKRTPFVTDSIKPLGTIKDFFL